MEIVRVYAPPGFFGPVTKMEKANCGQKAHIKKVRVVSESQVKAVGIARIHMPTSFSPIEFLIPGEKKFSVPEECFYISFSAKSIGFGQILRFEVS